MRISIVIPSYNQAEFLERTLDSVLAQQPPELEVLVLDGGSSDGSAEIIRRHADRLAFWRSARDAGQTAAIVEGFERATGDVLGWINSDDLLQPGALAAVARAFAADPRARWLAGGSHVIDERDRVLSRRRIIRGLTLPDLLYGHYRLPQESTFFRAELYRRVGGADPALHLAMDFDLWVKMLAEAGPPLVVDQPLGAYRIQPAQKTADMGRYAAEVAAVAARHAAKLERERPELLAGRWRAQATLPWRRFSAKVRADGLARSLAWVVERRLLGRA